MMTGTMTPLDELRMAELLCTRLCHDLTGPIGAVNNGAEFLSEEGFNMQSQAMELIITSAFSAVSRLQFYRVAYGRVKDQGEACLADKKKLAEDYFTGSKIVLDWPDSHTDAAGVSISLKMSRLIFNLLIIASAALIRGGTIAVRITQEGADRKEIHIRAAGSSVKWEEETQRILQGEDVAMTPKNVQTFLALKLANELSATLGVNAGDEKLELTASQACGSLGE